MKTVKLYYGSSMTPDWSIFETGAELPKLLKFCFEMELGFATLTNNEVEKIKNDFEKKYHFKLILCSEEFDTEPKNKTDFDIDLSDFEKLINDYI